MQSLKSEVKWKSEWNKGEGSQFFFFFLASLINLRESAEKENTKNLRELAQMTNYKINMQKKSVS